MKNFMLLNSSGPWTLFLSILHGRLIIIIIIFLQTSTASNYFSGFINKDAGTQFSL